MKKIGVLVIACLTLLPSVARAWGPDGHRIVAMIAECNLTRAAKAQVAKILPEGASLLEPRP